MFRNVQTFLSTLTDLTEQGYETFLKRPLFALGTHGKKVGGMFTAMPQRQAVAVYGGLLWVVPIAMVWQFESLYMVELGLSETEVGVYKSLKYLVGFFGFFIGGYVADFWGRKKAIVLFDALSWGGYCLSLSLATNKWWCVAAMVFLGFVSASVPAYIGLLSEGISARKRTTVFSVLQMVNQIPSALALPLLGGLWVAKRGLVPASQEMYWLFTGLVALGVFLRWRLLPRSKVFERTPRSWVHAIKNGIDQYQDSLNKFFQHPASVPILISKFLDEWIFNLWGMTYVSIYFVKHLGLRESNVAVLTQGSTYVGILILFLLVPHFTQRFMGRILGLDQVLGLVAMLILLFFGKGAENPLLVCLLASGFWAAGNSLYNSVNVAVWMNIVQEKERAKVVAVCMALIQLGLVTTSIGAVLYGKVSGEALLWFMVGLRVVGFFLLRRVATLLTR